MPPISTFPSSSHDPLQDPRGDEGGPDASTVTSQSVFWVWFGVALIWSVFGVSVIGAGVLIYRYCQCCRPPVPEMDVDIFFSRKFVNTIFFDIEDFKMKNEEKQREEMGKPSIHLKWRN